MGEKQLIEKACSMCGEIKNIGGFYSQKKRSKKRGNWIYYNPECKECTKEKALRWQRENEEKFKESKRKYNISEVGRKTETERKSEEEKEGGMKFIIGKTRTHSSNIRSNTMTMILLNKSGYYVRNTFITLALTVG